MFQPVFGIYNLSIIICKLFRFAITVCNENYTKFKYQNYTVAFKYNDKREVGIIKNFYNIGGSTYCVLQQLTKKRNFIDAEGNQSIIETLDRFFLICNMTNNLIIVRVENIITKCVYLNNCEEYFIIFCINDPI